MRDDMELLQEYVSHNSEEAFATLVSRYVAMVYSVALRHVSNPHHAQEVAQAVFILLARKSSTLGRKTIVSGWLFKTARLTAANFLRTESRRIRREQQAYTQSCLQAAGDATWSQVAPFLDEAIASLGEQDRNAVVLRYIQGLDLRAVGAALGATEEAAKKRVARAVEKLRFFFVKRGVTLSVTVLTGAIAAKSVQAAPAGLAAAITAGTLKGAALTTSTLTLVKGTLNIMAWTKVKIAVSLGIAALLAVQWHELAARKKQLALLQAQMAEQNVKDATDAVRVPSQDLNQVQAEKMELSNEVLRLRGQLASQKSREGKPSDVRIEQGAPAQNPGRQLGLAAAQGDPLALDNLRAMAKAEIESFNTNSDQFTGSDRGELARRTFAPLHAAFQALTEEAVKGNQNALEAISRAIVLPELQASAVESAGVLAGNGDAAALDLLTHPDHYGVLLAGAVGALKPAAEAGNQSAIDLLASVTTNDADKALWYLAADGLGKAAESGNATAVDALVRLSRSENSSARQAAISGLQAAAANQNTRAADALRQMEGQ